jgi:hypothetical protein
MQRVTVFVQQLVTQDISTGIQQFFTQHRHLINFVIGAGIVSLLAFLGKDILTAGAGIITDVVLVPIVTMMMRIAWSLRALAT